MASFGRRILVINPNSNPAVTAAVDGALAPLRFPGGPAVDVIGLEAGPFGIETDRDVAAVAPLVAGRVAADGESAAFVIACFSDPGLHASREAARGRPVLGIGASAVAAALARADRFGVVALSPGSVARHLRAHREAGVAGRLAGERALGASVADSAGAGIRERLLAVGRALVEEDWAGAVILGCAGMAAHRRPLEEALAVPVIEPATAAVALALSAVVDAPAVSGRGDRGRTARAPA